MTQSAREGRSPKARLLISSAAAPQLEAARQWVEHLGPPDEVVVMGATWGAADDFVRLCCPRSGGLIGFHRVTLLQVATELATPVLAEQGLVPITSLGIEAVAARVVFSCQHDEALEYFSPVADAPGFARALARTLRELRMEGPKTAGLEELGASGRDLAHLMGRYEWELQRGRIADLASIYSAATRLVREANCRYAGLPLLLLSVTPDSYLQELFLSAMVERSAAVLATALRGDIEGISRLESVLEVQAEDLDASGSEAPPAQGGAVLAVGGGREGDAIDTTRLQRLRRYLFSEQRPGVAEPPQDRSFEFLSAPGEGRECAEMARRVRFCAAEGIRFDSMAVALRSPETYLPLVEDALRRAGVPSYSTRGTTRPDPAGRAFLALLECASDGLSATRFAEYLSLGQVPLPDHGGAPPQPAVSWVEPGDEQLCFKTPVAEPPEAEKAEEKSTDLDRAPVLVGSLRTPARWEQLLVDAAVIGGRDRWASRLQGLVNEYRFRLKRLEDESDSIRFGLLTELRRLQHLQNFAMPLIAFLDELPARAKWSEWLTALENLASMALRRSHSVRAVLSELKPMGEVGPVGLEEVRQVLAERLTFLRVEPPDDRYGRVLLCTLSELAGRSFEVVFLPGLAEGIFPRKAFEDPLLLDGRRRELGLAASTDRQRLQERLLLRTGVAAARSRIVVSYPRVDLAQGRSRVPSFYALDLLRAAEGRLPDVSKLEKRAAQASRSRLGWPAPGDPRDAIDDAEFDLSVLDPLLTGTHPAPSGHGNFLLQVNPHLARSLRTRGRRWRNFFSEADGIVCHSPEVSDAPDAQTLELLRGERLRSRSYSPTALQQFALCPYKFLLYAVHRLRPREEVVAIEQLDPLTRGGLFHETQFELFKQLKKNRLLPIRRGNLRAVSRLADRVLDQVAGEYREKLAPAIPRVWSSEIEGLRTDLRGWLREVAEEGGAWIPYRFEFAFGLPPSPERDPDSRAEEAVVLGGVRLRGSIDLIERSPEGRLRVTDHKTGKAPSEKMVVVKGGEILQPLLYGLAAEQLLEEPVDAGQLYYCTQRGNYKRVTVPVNPGTCEKFKAALEIIDRSVEEGFLPAAPREKACDYCDYVPVCGPYEELRIQRKRKERLLDLQQLRELP